MRGGEGVVDGSCPDEGVDYNADVGVVPVELHETGDLGWADDFAGYEEVGEARGGEGFGFADFGDAAACCAGGDELVG